jgi:hypothetical protein
MGKDVNNFSPNIILTTNTQNFKLPIFPTKMQIFFFKHMLNTLYEYCKADKNSAKGRSGGLAFPLVPMAVVVQSDKSLGCGWCGSQQLCSQAGYLSIMKK